MYQHFDRVHFQAYFSLSLLRFALHCIASSILAFCTSLNLVHLVACALQTYILQYLLLCCVGGDGESVGNGGELGRAIFAVWLF
jgi:hypothetical protein